MILSGTGRGTIRRMVEGHARVMPRPLDHPPVPLHHLRWFPSPEAEDG